MEKAVFAMTHGTNCPRSWHCFFICNSNCKNKTGQDENHLALIHGLLIKNNPLLKVINNIPSKDLHVKSGKRKSSLPFFNAFHQYAPGGTQTRIQTLAGNCLIQLDDRGGLSFDIWTNIFDNLSKYVQLSK